MRALVTVMLLLVLPYSVAGDATLNTNPTVNMRTGVALTPCSNQFEEAITTSGRILKCLGGVWTYQGVTDIERIFVSRNITASDVGNNIYITANCPVNKRVLDGGCALLSGLGYNDNQTIMMDMAATDLSAWSCGYGLLNSNATKQYYFFGWANAAITAEAYCGVY